MTVPSTDQSAVAVRLPVVGEVVAQRYLVERFIARGGMAHVFAARHVELGSPLALKLLDPKVFVGVSHARVRFAREARLASQLKHPSIVEVFDVGVTETGLPFIAMELLEGDSLSELMAVRGPMPWPVARDIMLQVLDALQVAHSAGAVHRDVKPDNCLVVPGSLQVKLLDFGIARVLDETKVTRAGSVMGTPHYLAPEQARGAETDSRSDVYAAGIVLYEMLTGTCPFEEGTTFEIVAAHVNEPPPPLSSRIDISELPPGLPALMEQVLAKDPDARPADAGGFADAIRGLDIPPAKGVKPVIWLGAALAAFVVGISTVGIAMLLAPQPSALETTLGSLATQTAVDPPANVDPAPVDDIEPVDEFAGFMKPLEPLDPLESESEPEAVPEPVVDVLDAEEAASPQRRRPSRRLQVARKVRKAVSSCARFAPPAGARVSLRATVKAGGSIRGVQIRPPYAGSVLGRCVAKAVGMVEVGRGSAITFDQAVLVGG